MTIAAAPAERFALRVFEAGEIDAALRERIELLNRVVVADHADELHRRLMTRARGEVHGRAAEDIVGAAEQGLDGIECDAANYKDGH